MGCRCGDGVQVGDRVKVVMGDVIDLSLMSLK